MAWPTSENPRTRTLAFRATEEEGADVEAYAQNHGISLSETLRRATELLTSGEAARTRAALAAQKGDQKKTNKTKKREEGQ